MKLDYGSAGPGGESRGRRRQMASHWAIAVRHRAPVGARLPDWVWNHQPCAGSRNERPPTVLPVVVKAIRCGLNGSRSNAQVRPALAVPRIPGAGSRWRRRGYDRRTSFEQSPVRVEPRYGPHWTSRKCDTSQTPRSSVPLRDHCRRRTQPLPAQRAAGDVCRTVPCECERAKPGPKSGTAASTTTTIATPISLTARYARAEVHSTGPT